ncbi:hypothetical protein SAMN04488553_1421 [Gramella sp. MAR_2010_147]|nr:hypothetical protein SAMN04488553_1421 [Gramella sp. MAR_2010_147]
MAFLFLTIHCQPHAKCDDLNIDFNENYRSLTIN